MKPFSWSKEKNSNMEKQKYASFQPHKNYLFQK